MSDVTASLKQSLCELKMENTGNRLLSDAAGGQQGGKRGWNWKTGLRVRGHTTTANSCSINWCSAATVGKLEVRTGWETEFRLWAARQPRVKQVDRFPTITALWLVELELLTVTGDVFSGASESHEYQTTAHQQNISVLEVSAENPQREVMSASRSVSSAGHGRQRAVTVTSCKQLGV